MHFVGAAKRWYNAVESRLRECSWETLSSLVLERFGKDHHELLLRQLFQIRQTGTVAEYIEQFSAIVDQLGAYHRTTDPLFFTMRFIDGLKENIRLLFLCIARKIGILLVSLLNCKRTCSGRRSWRFASGMYHLAPSHFLTRRRLFLHRRPVQIGLQCQRR